MLLMILMILVMLAMPVMMAMLELLKLLKSSLELELELRKQPGFYPSTCQETQRNPPPPPSRRAKQFVVAHDTVDEIPASQRGALGEHSGVTQRLPTLLTALGQPSPVH